MDISPQTIRSTGFKTVKKGYDPQEVDLFRTTVAAAVETAQNQAAAMEARARAAVAKLQEVSQQAAETKEVVEPTRRSGDTEVISRTLLLAQRTADSTVAEARIEAESITGIAREEASRVLDSARTMAAKTIDDSRLEARRAVEDERMRAENEVQSLLARRDFLLGDVDHLEHYLQAQRERLRDAAVQLQELVDRVPGGLGDMRRPLLSASADPLPAEPVAVEQVADQQAPGEPLAGDPVLADPPAAVQLPPPPGMPPMPVEQAAQRAAAEADSEPLFTPVPDRSADLSALALSGDADAQNSVWRLLDEEVASTQAAQAAAGSDDDTAEVAAPPAPGQEHEPFRVVGDELR